MGTLKRRIIENMEPTEHELARRWIPVTERLPSRGSSVLCVNAEHRVYGQGWFSEGDYAIRWNEGVHVTHWMPLPTPPPMDGK
jgi:hypothetical protein